VAIDAAVAVVAIAVSWVILSGDGANWPAGSRDPDGIAYALVVVVNAPLAFRRRAWGAALAIALAAGTAYTARQYPPILAPAVPLIVYLAATRLDDRRSRVVLIVTALVSWIGATLAPGATDPASVFVVAGAWLLGHYVRTRRLLVAELEQRAVDLEREREERARRAVAEERLRIARDLHDVLAHSIAVINAQASVATHLAETATGRPPGDLATAMGVIAQTSRTAMSELRATLDVLRGHDPSATSADELAPAPGMARLDGVVQSARSAGVDLTVDTVGEQRFLAPAVDVTAYRIVQEALTNVARHARGSTARLTVEYRPASVRLTVSDDGGALNEATTGGGYGIVGMTERAHAIGGHLTASPRTRGGFEVVADLPTQEEDHQ
jgi:signal transduction histidine kinase